MIKCMTGSRPVAFRFSVQECKFLFENSIVISNINYCGLFGRATVEYDACPSTASGILVYRDKNKFDGNYNSYVWSKGQKMIFPDTPQHNPTNVFSMQSKAKQTK